MREGQNMRPEYSVPEKGLREAKGSVFLFAYCVEKRNYFILMKIEHRILERVMVPGIPIMSILGIKQQNRSRRTLKPAPPAKKVLPPG